MLLFCCLVSSNEKIMKKNILLCPSLVFFPAGFAFQSQWINLFGATHLFARQPITVATHMKLKATSLRGESTANSKARIRQEVHLTLCCFLLFRGFLFFKIHCSEVTSVVSSYFPLTGSELVLECWQNFWFRGCSPESAAGRVQFLDTPFQHPCSPFLGEYNFG